MASSSTLERLKGFKLDRVLNEDAPHRRIVLLGKIQEEQALLIVDKTQFDSNEMSNFVASLADVSDLGSNDIYTWLVGNTRPTETSKDLKMTLLCPCTAVHIKKHEPQEYRLVRETPELYASVVVPFMDSIPPQRLQWVWNFLAKKSEGEKILYDDPDPKSGFVIAPDLKWDQKDMSQLYLQAVVHNRSLRSLRDLRAEHAPMLRDIIAQAEKLAKGYGLENGTVRCWVHYQPSYYHFHVHIMHIGCESSSRNISLDDIIDNLESFSEIEKTTGIGFYQKKTLTYELGAKHGLFDALWQAQSGIKSSAAAMNIEGPAEGQGWNGISLWLVPSKESVHSGLRQAIKDIAQVYNTPSFEPHLTLLGGIPFTTDVTSLLHRVQSGLSTWATSKDSSDPLTLSYVKVGRKNIYFQSLFMHCTLSPVLQSLRAILQSELSAAAIIRADTREYMPHLSLLYSSKATDSQKDDLTRSILQDKHKLSEGVDSTKLQGIVTVEAKELVVIRSKSGVDSWRVLARIPLQDA